MKITITDPADGNPGCTGYYTAEIERDGQIDATIEVAPQYLAHLLPDIEDPDEIADFFEEAAEGARSMAETIDEQEGE